MVSNWTERVAIDGFFAFGSFGAAAPPARAAQRRAERRGLNTDCIRSLPPPGEMNWTECASEASGS